MKHKNHRISSNLMPQDASGFVTNESHHVLLLRVILMRGILGQPRSFMRAYKEVPHRDPLGSMGIHRGLLGKGPWRRRDWFKAVDI